VHNPIKGMGPALIYDISLIRVFFLSNEKVCSLSGLHQVTEKRLRTKSVIYHSDYLHTTPWLRLEELRYGGMENYNSELSKIEWSGLCIPAALQSGK
jgi:hypothetical protein